MTTRTGNKSRGHHFSARKRFFKITRFKFKEDRVSKTDLSPLFVNVDQTAVFSRAWLKCTARDLKHRVVSVGLPQKQQEIDSLQFSSM